MPESEQYAYPVVIVGGGMVGSTLAAALARCGGGALRVLVVESATLGAADEPPAQPGFDARSTALSHGSRVYLEQLGLWPGMASWACPIRRIHVSDRGRFGAVRMDCRDHQVEALGHVVENLRMGQVLNQALRGAPGVELWDGASVESLRPAREGARLTVRRDGHSHTVHAQLVVLAEGGRSGLSETLGIERASKPYGQSAVIANVAFQAPHADTAYERFTPEGPLALLPLPSRDGENRAALVWTREASQAARLLALDDAAFLTELQQTFGNRVGRFLRLGRRHGYPLSLCRAEEVCHGRVVLLGNAAQTLHPVAGQGFNLALRNTVALADTILAAWRRGNDPGAAASLRAYQELSRRDRDRTLAFSDYMTRLFSSQRQSLVWARKFGLFSIDLLPPVKRSFVARAMGQGEPMVRLPMGGTDSMESGT